MAEVTDFKVYFVRWPIAVYHCSRHLILGKDFADQSEVATIEPDLTLIIPKDNLLHSLDHIEIFEELI